MSRVGALISSIAAAALVVAAITGPAAARTNRLNCGVERWTVKTLQDRPTLLSGHRTTISRLASRPADQGDDGARSRSERFAYVVRAQLVKAKFERDEDIHLVIVDPQNGATMIAEFPAPDCETQAKPRHAALMNSARQAFLEGCGALSSRRWKRLSGTADLTGVQFFDFDHGQAGVAPNAVELHPVLRFRLLSQSCSAGG